MRSSKKYQIQTDPIPGTRDFLPPDMMLRNWLFGKWKATARSYGFEEYDCPVLEWSELYKLKSGEDILDSMFNLELEDEEKSVALRPEMTPSLARIMLRESKKLMFPCKWFSIPQCWRCEPSERGVTKQRELFQWNMDIWGISEISCEAELLSSIVSFLKSVGLTSDDFCINVSSRKLLQKLMQKLSISLFLFEKMCVVIEKLPLLGDEKTIELLEKIGLKVEVAKELLKAIKIEDIGEMKKFLGDDIQCVEDLVKLFEYSKGYGIENWCKFNAKIVRGRAYYTGIVFEVFFKEEERVIAGGGRYDNILGVYGAKENIPACGYGFSDCIIMEILEKKKLLPKLKHKVDDVVIPLNSEYYIQAAKIAAMLRESGRSVDIIMKDHRRVRGAYSYADRIGADRAILVAPDELLEGKVRVKYLREEKKEINMDIEKLC